jgi:hypothetical protein
LARGGHVAKAERILRLVVAVEHLGSQVETVGPDDGSGFGVDSDLGKEVRAIEGPDQGRPRFTRRELDITHDAVIEEQPHDMRSEDGDPYNERVGECIVMAALRWYLAVHPRWHAPRLR